jgi:alpha-tubulin suppressor-like RCC1 family protein
MSCFLLWIVQSPTRIAFNWYFWGAEEGRGNTLGGNQEVPQQIEAEITDVSAGSRHTFLIEAGGTVQAAGFIESDSGYKGHLGLGPSITRCEGREIWSGVCKEQDVLRPVTTVVDADGNKVDAPPFRHAYAGVGVASDSGAMHALLISEDGKAYLSGNNNKGQLCLGNLDPVDYFHEVKGVDNVVNGAVGEDFTLLVTESGQVYGCGSNTVGQLGEGPELAQSNVPIEIKGEAGDINGITEVATGLGFAIYLNGETGEVWGSGSNIYGQLCAFTEGIPSIYLPQVRPMFIEQSTGPMNTFDNRDHSCLIFVNSRIR